MCRGRVENGPLKRFTRCAVCRRIHWEKNEGDACGLPAKLNPGDKVTTSGYEAVVVRQYSEGMYELRLRSGVVCVDIGDIASRHTPGCSGDCDVMPDGRLACATPIHEVAS